MSLMCSEEHMYEENMQHNDESTIFLTPFKIDFLL